MIPLRNAPSVAGLLAAATLPGWVADQKFGLWEIATQDATGFTPGARRAVLDLCGCERFRTLHRVTLDTMMLPQGEVVMDDSPGELKRHLPLWLAAHGRVLLSGLGLGCALRGLLTLPTVDHVDVVEIDRQILRIIGPEFIDHPKVALHRGDALTYSWPRGTRWDVAWHDIWDDEESLAVLHAHLLRRYDPWATQQGCWQFPRDCKRIWPAPLLGAKRRIRKLKAA